MASFKVSLVIVVAIFAITLQVSQALSDEKKNEIRAKLLPHIESCGKDNGGITLDYLKEFKEQKKIPDDTNKCFFACVFKKVGLLNDQGLFDDQKAVERGSKYVDEAGLAKVKEAAQNCVKVNQETVSDAAAGCDRAKHLYSCLIEQKQNFGFVW